MVHTLWEALDLYFWLTCSGLAYAASVGTVIVVVKLVLDRLGIKVFD